MLLRGPEIAAIFPLDAATAIRPNITSSAPPPHRDDIAYPDFGAGQHAVTRTVVRQRASKLIESRRPPARVAIEDDGGEALGVNQSEDSGIW